MEPFMKSKCSISQKLEETVAYLFRSIHVQDMCGINDPLGQNQSPVRSDHYSHLKVVLCCEILKSEDGQTPRGEMVITTGCGSGTASWINILLFLSWTLYLTVFLTKLCPILHQYIYSLWAGVKRAALAARNRNLWSTSSTLALEVGHYI